MNNITDDKRAGDRPAGNGSVLDFSRLSGDLSRFAAVLPEKGDAWYISVLDSLSFPLRVADAGGNWLFVNAAAEKLFGISRGEMLGKPCDHNKFCICGTDNCSIVRAKNGMRQTFFQHEDRHFRVEVEILRDTAGALAGFIETIHNITESVNRQEYLKNILNGMNALITVCTPEDWRILFINDSIRGYFNIKGNGVGQICYEVLQGRDKPCVGCPHQRLLKKPESVIEWIHHESVQGRVLHKTARLIDWPGVGKAHLEYAQDITALLEAEEVLRHKEKQLKNLNQAATVFLSQNIDNFEETLSAGIIFIGEIVGVDKISVFRNEQSRSGLFAAQIFCWHKEKGCTVSEDGGLLELSYERHIPRWLKALSSGESVRGLIHRMPEARELEALGFLTGVFAMPVINKGEFWGFVLFETQNSEREYTEDETDILSSASSMLATTFIRKDEELLHEQTRQNHDRAQQMMLFHHHLVFMLADLLESRDANTGGHIDRTTAYLKIVVEAMLEQGVYAEELEGWNMESFVSSARLHDLGKIAVSDVILNKPGPLTDKEAQAMKVHPVAGARIISRLISRTGESEFLHNAQLTATYHHERWDGKGYPHGLKGTAIPLQGRIMAIVDVYDALTTVRPYKAALTSEEAYEIILRDIGQHFDPQIVKVFAAVRSKIETVKTIFTEPRFSDDDVYIIKPQNKQ